MKYLHKMPYFIWFIFAKNKNREFEQFSVFHYDQIMMAKPLIKQ